MDPLESLRVRSVAVTEAAEQMALSYGEIWYEREALRKRVDELERREQELKDELYAKGDLYIELKTAVIVGDALAREVNTFIETGSADLSDRLIEYISKRPHAIRIHTDPTVGRWPDHEAGTMSGACEMCPKPGTITLGVRG